jgi:hypothetical protein
VFFTTIVCPLTIIQCRGTFLLLLIIAACFLCPLFSRHFHLQSSTTEGVGLGQEMMDMLQKMKTEDYQIPPSLNLTPECCKLLRAMLQPHTEQRIKMSGIMSDPWFLTHLPPNAINMNDGYLAKPRPCAQTEADIRTIVQRAARTQL